jgi:phage gpG-like protein
VSFKVTVTGIDNFNKAMQDVARAMGPPYMAEGLREAGGVIQRKAQENILEQELYLTGELYNAVRVQVVNQYAVSILVACDHGAVHEFGYTGVITDRQRRFFWAKHAETGGEMWRALALSATYTIPARPYLRPAVDSEQDKAAWEFKLYLARVLSRELGITV